MGSKSAAFLLSAIFLTGCKGFWHPPSSGSGSGGSSATSGDFYVLNLATNQIAGYYINAGTLTALPGSPYTTPTLAAYSKIALAPNDNFLYVSSANGIYVYTRSSTGQLTLGNSSQPVSGDQAVSMQVSPDSGWLVDVASGAPSVHALPINSSNGTATSNTEPYVSLPASTVQQVAISPDGTYVLVAMGAGGTATIPFNQSATSNTNPFGSVGTIALVNSAGGALSVAFDPLQSGQTAPRFFYIGESAAVSGSNSGGLRIFNFSNFKELSGSPLGTQGTKPVWILPKSSGDFVYVANEFISGSNTGVIAGYTVGTSNGAYTVTALKSTFTAGTNPVALAEDNTGSYVFAVDLGGNPDLKGYTFDTTTAGNLDADSGVSKATGTDPVQAGAIAAAH